MSDDPSIFCSELRMPTAPGTPPLPPVVIVGPSFDPPPQRSDETIDEDGRRRTQYQQCSAEHALIAADYLVGHALALAPYLVQSRALGELVDQLWPAIRDRAFDLIDPGPRGSKLLRSYIEREVAARLTEEMASRREAARLAGLNQSRDLLVRIWNCCIEENPAARSVALAALSAELRPILPYG